MRPYRRLIYATALLALALSGCDDAAGQNRLDGDADADGDTGEGGVDLGPDGGRKDGGGTGGDFGLDSDLGPDGDEVCNGIDDDGDGVADEATSGQECTGSGAAEGCRFTGKTECRDGNEICVVSETCNGQDDDCDGTVDETIEETDCFETVEECRIRGTRRCVDGAFVCEIPDTPPEADDEICDGADNDCDGIADEDLTPETCSAGHAACRTEALEECADGAWRCPAQPDLSQASEEICDGIDDDCDGVIDEGVPTRGECSAGEGVCRVSADETCVDGAWTCPAMEDRTPLTAETCNARDDDCDGRIDEGDGPNGGLLGETCSAGEGVCRVEASEECRDGELICPAVPADERARAEICNGLDDDCDGQVDAARPEGAIDQRPVCGEYVTQNCRLWLGWSRRVGSQEPGADYEGAYSGWGQCPATTLQHEGSVRCNASERAEMASSESFYLIPVDGEDPRAEPTGHYVGDNDKLAWAFECGFQERDRVRAEGGDVRFVELQPLEAWIKNHCSAYLAHASDPFIPMNVFGPAPGAEMEEPYAREWPGCTGDARRGTLDDRWASCNSTTGDFRFRPVRFPRLVNETDAVGVAFRCRVDVEDPDAHRDEHESVLAQLGEVDEHSLAMALERDIEIFFAWAPPMADGVRDQQPTWAGCGQRGEASSPDGAWCVGSGGDGAFHAVRLTEGDAIGFFGFALKSRPRTQDLGEPQQR